MRTERIVFLGGVTAFLLGGASLAVGVVDNMEINGIIDPQVDQAKGVLSGDEVSAAKSELKGASGEITKLVDAQTWNKWGNTLDTASFRARIAEIKQVAAGLDNRLNDDLDILDKQAERQSYAATLRESFQQSDERNTYLMVGGTIAVVVGVILSALSLPSVLLRSPR